MTYSGPVETKTMTLRSVSPVYHDIFFHIISVFSTKTLKKIVPKWRNSLCVYLVVVVLGLELRTF